MKKDFDTWNFKKKDIDELKGEMADVLQCLISIYTDIEDQFNINIIDDILPKVMEKNEKWERITNKTLVK